MALAAADEEASGSHEMEGTEHEEEGEDEELIPEIPSDEEREEPAPTASQEGTSQGEDGQAPQIASL